MSIATPNGFQLDNSGKRVVVDPITRIEGHLRVEVNVDANNVIRNAVSTGTMWRGLEVILKGRDPRDAWAFVERICGVCTGCHALTSVRAVEDALGIKIPKNAHLIREMMAKGTYATLVLSTADLDAAFERLASHDADIVEDCRIVQKNNPVPQPTFLYGDGEYDNGTIECDLTFEDWVCTMDCDGSLSEC